MKKSRYTDSQILSILKQNEAGATVPDLCREHSMSTATFYKWRSRYGGMDASLMKRMKELEDENRRLKKMYAEEKLKAEIVKEALEKKRWRNAPTPNLVLRYGLAALLLASAKPVIATKLNYRLKTMK